MSRVALALLLLAFGIARSALAQPGSVSVAAAANFVYALETLNAAFRHGAPDITLRTTTGASGTLFAQLDHGAPFDVFLSADTDYPQRAIATGLAEAASFRTFATGRLVFWTTRSHVDVGHLSAVVRSHAVKKIALAQPKTAPYGRAAQAALERLGLWTDAQPKLVIGESISQTAQFIETGNADAGFVALSLVRSPRLANRGRWREIPPELYAPISLDHGAVLTKRGAKNPAAQRYLEFLGSEPAKKILRDFGYGI